jgi:hypothetical protein
MNLDTINPLFLELSQVATAKTAKEIRYEKALREILELPHKDETTEMQMRLIAKEALIPKESNNE